MLSRIDESAFEVLMGHTSFRVPQLRQIKERFISLDFDSKGYVTIEDVLTGIPNITKHPIAERILETLTAVDEYDLPEDC